MSLINKFLVKDKQIWDIINGNDVYLLELFITFDWTELNEWVAHMNGNFLCLCKQILFNSICIIIYGWLILLSNFSLSVTLSLSVKYMRIFYFLIITKMKSRLNLGLFS